MHVSQARLAAIVLVLCIVAWGVGDTPAAHLPAATAPSATADFVTVWYDIHDLIQEPAGTDHVKKLITDVVQTGTWKDNGGDMGLISSYGSQLIITQTPQAQQEIKVLLEKLRQLNESRGALVTIDAYWVHLTPAQLPPGQATVAATLLTDPAVVFAQARTVGFDGSTVATTLKRSVAVVTGMTPVVAPGAVAYDPQISSKEYEISFSEIPSEADSNSVRIAFENSVSMPVRVSEAVATKPTTAPTQPVPLTINADNEVAGSTTVALQTSSVVRLKLGVPTVVSGMSDQPGSSGNRTLCLVLCATVTQPK